MALAAHSTDAGNQVVKVSSIFHMNCLDMCVPENVLTCVSPRMSSLSSLPISSRSGIFTSSSAAAYTRTLHPIPPPEAFWYISDSGKIL